jgi:hypothetical protein
VTAKCLYVLAESNACHWLQSVNLQVRFPITAGLEASHQRQRGDGQEGCAFGKGWHGASSFLEARVLRWRRDADQPVGNRLQLRSCSFFRQNHATKQSVLPEDRLMMAVSHGDLCDAIIKAFTTVRK